MYSINAPLLVAVKNISNPNVLVRSPDGYTPDGLPYYNFSHLVADGRLDPSELTRTRSLTFYNPNQVQFTYDLVVLAQLNQAPIIQTQPSQAAVAGKAYSYQVQASDPNGDALTYQLRVAPSGMTVDIRTGLISWQPTTANAGNHSVILQVSDGRGGTTTQTYTLAVLESPANRPPNFTTTPEVDAYVNQPYQYDADATDPDQDTPLTYSLVSGPDGTTIDPSTGLLQWTPPSALVLGDTVLGSINTAGQSDEFVFSGVAGQRIYFDPLQYSGSSSDWKVEGYSPSGQRLDTLYLSSNQLLNLAETGNYRINVSRYDDRTGTYGFSVIDVAAVPAITSDTLIQGTLTPGTEDDLYRFTGRGGQKLYFDKLSNTGNLDWILYRTHFGSFAKLLLLGHFSKRGQIAEITFCLRL